jgi:hypothetical protein
MAQAMNIDEAPERGQSQLAITAGDPEVMAALASSGADVAGEIAATATTVTDDGEVLDVPRDGDAANHDAQYDAPEPGSNG